MKASLKHSRLSLSCNSTRKCGFVFGIHNVDVASHRQQSASASASLCKSNDRPSVQCAVGRGPFDGVVAFTQEEAQLHNAVTAASTPNNQVLMSMIRMSKAFVQYVRQHPKKQTPFRSGEIHGLRSQYEHVIHILQQHGNALIPQDLALLAQACRRLRMVTDKVPELKKQQDALCAELVATALRSQNMAQADLLVWAILLHGLASAGVKSPDMHKLLTWVIQHLPSRPLSSVPPTGTSRPRACARTLWAFAHVGYQGDVSPLLQYIMNAVQSGFMQNALASHRSQLLWSAAKLQLPTPQLRQLVDDLLPALCQICTEDPEQLNTTVISGTCHALAQAGVSKENGESCSFDAWVSVVQDFVEMGGLNGSSQSDMDQLRAAAAVMQIDLGPNFLLAPTSSSAPTSGVQNGSSSNGSSSSQASSNEQVGSTARNGAGATRRVAMMNGSASDTSDDESTTQARPGVSDPLLNKHYQSPRGEASKRIHVMDSDNKLNGGSHNGNGNGNASINGNGNGSHH